MKIAHHLGRFSTFFKESSLIVQLVIVISGIGIVAGTATVAAMVATPTSNTAEVSEIKATDNNSHTTADTDSSTVTSKQDEQSSDTDGTGTTSQTSQTTPQTTDTQDATQSDSTSDTSQQEPQASPQPTYADTYPFASDCVSNPQYTSTQIDPYGYNKCYSSSYTAFKVAQTFGTAPQNWVDPKQWPIKADNANIPRGTTPKLHSVGIQTTGGAGWSVWVEAVHDNNTIDISYYNWNNNLSHGTQYNVNPSAFSTYIYFGE